MKPETKTTIVYFWRISVGLTLFVLWANQSVLQQDMHAQQAESQALDSTCSGLGEKHIDLSAEVGDIDTEVSALRTLVLAEVDRIKAERKELQRISDLVDHNSETHSKWIDAARTMTARYAENKEQAERLEKLVGELQTICLQTKQLAQQSSASVHALKQQDTYNTALLRQFSKVISHHHPESSAPSGGLVIE